MSSHKHVTDFFCSGIGLSAGVYAKITEHPSVKTIAANISIVTSMDTIWYAFLGASIGLLVSFFGKIILHKLQRKFFPKWKKDE
jgi:hypothetical protein